jgi:acyl-CoA synthetase (AMP-forming)/AMP-acid ligase II
VATDKSGWVVGHVLARQVRLRGDQPFIQFEDDDPLTYAEFDRQCNRVGNAFAEVGVGFGDRVAILAANRLEYLWTWIGLSRIGAVAVAVNTAYKGRFLTHVLTNTGARMGVVEREFLAWLAEIEDDIPALATVYVPGPRLEPGEAPAFKRLELRAFEELLGAAPDAIQREVSYRDIGLIMFTSGTTGPSKGVLMPHGHLFLFGLNMRVHMGLSPADRYYICMPLFHAQGLLMQFYGILQAGGYAILARQFRASTWIDEVRKHRATVTNTLGVMTDFVLRQPPKPSDRDHQLRLLCALPVTADTLRALRERFGIPKFNELFGMTECNLPVARPLDAPDEAGCSGKIWEEFFEVIIADPETDEPLPVGTVGWLAVAPQAIGVSSVTAGRDSLTVTARVAAQPVMTLGPKPAATDAPLPPNTPLEGDDSIRVTLPVVADYATVAAEIANAFHLRDGGIRYPAVGRSYVKPTSVDVLSNGPDLVVRVGFKGAASGVLYLAGTPVYDSVTHVVSVPNLDYVPETRNLVLRLKEWLGHDDLRNDLRAKATLDLTQPIQQAVALLTRAMNQTVGPVTLAGAVGRLDVAAVGVDGTRRQVRATVVASGRLSAAVAPPKPQSP